MFVTNAMLCQFALYVKSIPPWGVMGKKANLRRVGGAVFGVFLLSGWALASWMARIPEIRDHLGLTPGELGRILLVGAVGAVLALTTAGLVVDRLGAAFTVRAGAMLTAVGLVSTGIGASTVASAVIVAAGLFACGYGLAAWDVAMNVEGAAVERLQGRALMPRLHAGFSLGTVAGAGLGAGAAAIKAPVALHLGVVGGFVLLTVLMLVRYFTPRHTAEADTTSHGHARLRDAWREPRTMLIGVVVLAFALAEGVANEWLAVGLVDGFDVPPALGVVGFATFLTAMTVTRLVGGFLVDRWGRAAVLRTSAVTAIVGVLLVVFGGSLPVALLGAAAWGAGAALGFPLGMSAGADDPERAAVRVSVVSSIGYTAFLVGPPLLGWLGDQVGVHRALLVTTAAMVVGVLVASAARDTTRTEAAKNVDEAGSAPAPDTAEAQP